MGSPSIKILQIKMGLHTECGEDNTSGHVDKYLDIRSLVTFETPTSFAHFIFGGPLKKYGGGRWKSTSASQPGLWVCHRGVEPG